MENETQQEADEIAISFDLNTFFDESNDNINIIQEGEIRVSVLCEVMDAVTQNFPEFRETPEVADETTSEKFVKSNRFPTLPTDEVDEIASNTVKKKNRKQTVWGIKEFRGKEFF